MIKVLGPILPLVDRLCLWLVAYARIESRFTVETMFNDTRMYRHAR